MAQGGATARKNVPTSGQSNVVTSDSTGHEDTLTERHYLVPIKDSHGHAERVNLRVLPLYITRLNKILESKKFPFRSTNDVVRYAIDRVCTALETRAGLPTSTYRQIEAMKRVLIHSEEQLQFLTTFDDLQQHVQELTARGAYEAAVKDVADYKHHIDAMEEGYWKRRYTHELTTRFGHVLRVNPGEGAQLGDIDTTDTGSIRGSEGNDDE